ncbi:MAG: bifunctional UDP-N-acetylglucosamine diphosphorylase/glucosamine-1-phosphate N-acetyltransferase GlmU [Solirubrobacterales bacterium]
MAGPTVLIMAAGEGTRMRSSLPKMMHPVCGRPMVAWPVAAARDAGADRIAVIVSPDRDLSPVLPEGTETVTQPEADGTGGAIRAALDLVREAETVAVVPGDHPLISGELLGELFAAHAEAGAAATVMSVELDDPGAYGRLVRTDDGAVDRIVETKHPDSVPSEILAIREISTSTFAFDGAALASALERLASDNEAGEYYLGDVLPLLRADGLAVGAYLCPDPAANLGVNHRADLALVATEARRRIARRHMIAGVTITDPAATWIDVDVEIAPDATIEPGCVLRGATRIGPGAEIRAHSYVVDAEVGDGCLVGPFAYLRPGTRPAASAKAGNFVEIKNSQVGEGTKVPHLSYLGDADVGSGANVGAGTITANYDGFTKSRTKIGERARIGVDTSLVAPVDVGDDAYTGAGAVIREDVPPGALGVSQGEQRNIEGFAERKRAHKEAQESTGEDQE